MNALKSLALALLAGGFLSLAACATTSGPNATSSVTKQWAQACTAYTGAQKLIIQNEAKLSDSQLRQVLIVTHQITPLCSALPKDPQAATQNITAAVTKLGVIEAVLGAKK